MAGVASQPLSTHLQTLRRLQLVERRIPVTESPTASKRGRYRIASPLFRFVYGNQDQLRMPGDDAYDELVAGECTFTSQPVSEGVLSNLERTAAEVRWSGTPDGKTLYVLFSRSGYTDDLEHIADTRDDVLLFDLSEIIS